MKKLTFRDCKRNLWNWAEKIGGTYGSNQLVLLQFRDEFGVIKQLIPQVNDERSYVAMIFWTKNNQGAMNSHDRGGFMIEGSKFFPTIAICSKLQFKSVSRQTLIIRLLENGERRYRRLDPEYIAGQWENVNKPVFDGGDDIPPPLETSLFELLNQKLTASPVKTSLHKSTVDNLVYLRTLHQEAGRSR